MQYTRLDPCYRHHTSLIQLQNASDSGCPICIQIFATIKAALSVFMSETSSFWIVFKPEDDDLKVSFVDDRGAHGNIVDFKVLKFTCEEYKDNKDSTPLHSNLLKVSQDFVTAKMDQELRRNHTPNDPSIVPMPEMFIGIERKHWSFPISSDNLLPTNVAIPFSERTDNAAVVKLAQDWLATCVRDHTSTCSHAPGYTPPRLLDLRGSSVRLILRQQIKAPNMSYAALSHCWGRAPQNLVLTSENCTSLLDGIRVDDLPQTFQDAISLCRKLAISFLWIDSLCIMQQGKEHARDWQLHVLEMSSIYSKCILCIAADSAADGSGGLFINRDTKFYQPIAVDVRSWHGLLGNDPSSSTSSDREIDEVIENGLLVLNVSHIDEDFRKCPLSIRAWAYQERFLAPRVLHFGLHQIYYECLSGDLASECFPGGGKIFHLPSLSERLGSFTFDPSISPEEQWSSIVSSYSGRLLTHNSDKLAALAGVAQQFAKRNSLTEYLAGFFSFHTLTPLLWRVTETRQHIQTNKSGPQSIDAYIAPSWSWAAVTVPVEFPDITSNDIVQNHNLAHTQGYKCKFLDNGNKFGQLLHASITVNAPFCDIMFKPNIRRVDHGSGEIHHHYRSTLDVALKVTRCHPSPKYQFHPILAWAQPYNQHLLRELLLIRGQDLSNSNRTPQIDEYVSIAFDEPSLELGPEYRIIWIRRRQSAELYNINVIHEGIILKRGRSRSPFHRDPYTRIGYIGHWWELTFKHEWDSIMTRGSGFGHDWEPISIADFKAPDEKTKTFKLL